MAPFGKLIRFRNSAGDVKYGEARHLENFSKDGLLGAKVFVYEGNEPCSPDFKLSDREEEIVEVCPSRLFQPFIFDNPRASQLTLGT